MKQLLRIFGLFITFTLIGSLVSPLVLAQTGDAPVEESTLQSDPVEPLPVPPDPSVIQVETQAPPPAGETPPVSAPEELPPVQEEPPILPPTTDPIDDSLGTDPVEGPVVTDPVEETVTPDPVIPANNPEQVDPETIEPEVVETVVTTEPPVEKQTTRSSSGILPPECQPVTGRMSLAVAASSFCDLTPTPTSTSTTIPTPTPTSTATITPTPTTIRISRIVVDCSGSGQVAVRDAVAGSSITLGVRYKETAASSWKNASGSVTVPLDAHTGQRIYSFTIDILTGVPTDAFDIRVSVLSTSGGEFSHTSVDSATLCPCFATPTPTPTTPPNVVSIARIAAVCTGEGTLTVSNPVAGATVILELRYRSGPGVVWTDSGATTTVTLTDGTGHVSYPFTIDVVTGVPPTATQLRVEIRSASGATFTGLSRDSQIFGFCVTPTPSETPTETPTQTPTETPTVTPTQTPTETPTLTPTPTECPNRGNRNPGVLTFFQVQSGPCPTETPTETLTETPTQTPTVTPTPTECPNRANRDQGQQTFFQVQAGPCPTESPTVTTTPSSTPVTSHVPKPTTLVQALPSTGTTPAHSDSDNGLIFLMLAGSVSLAGIGFLMVRDSRAGQRE